MEKEIGALIRELRTRLGLSVEVLAKKAEIAPSTLRRWEQGQTLPCLDELRRVLEGAQAGDQYPYAITLISANRAWTHQKSAQQETRQSPPGFDDFPPAPGDLIHAMRLRRGLYLIQVAEAIGIHQSTVSRWEQGKKVVPEERLDALCDVLGAYPEERIALRQNRVFLAPPLREESPSFERLEQQFHALKEKAWHHVDIPGDLQFFTREAALWERALKDTAARALLVHVWIEHCGYLYGRGRPVEARRIATSAYDAAPTCVKGDSLHLQAAHTYASSIIKGPGSNPRRAIRVLNDELDLALTLKKQSGVYRDLASFEFESGQRDRADGLIKWAREAAQENDDLVGIRLANDVEVSFLLDLKRPEEAIRLLPTQFDPLPGPRLTEYRYWFRTLLALNDTSGAQHFQRESAALVVQHPSVAGHW